VSRRGSAAAVVVVALVLVGCAVLIPGLLSPAEDPGDDPSALAAPPAGSFPMVVDSIHDGDTLNLRVEEPNDVVTTTRPITVRLIGIDTPEIYPEYECYGDEATDRLRELVPVGSTVHVTVDADTWDPYDRRLFYLWTPDGELVNLRLVAEGYAEAIRIAPNDAYWPELRDAESDARDARMGLWGACPWP